VTVSPNITRGEGVSQCVIGHIISKKTDVF
jgi:hypothetical protein